MGSTLFKNAAALTNHVMKKFSLSRMGIAQVIPYFEHLLTLSECGGYGGYKMKNGLLVVNTNSS